MTGVPPSAFYARALIDLASGFPDLAALWSVESEIGSALPHDALPDYSVAGVERRAAAISSLLKEQRELDPKDATPLDRRNGDVLSSYLNFGLGPTWVGTRGQRFRHHDYPVNHFFGAQSMLVYLMTQAHRIASAADAEDYLRRLERMPHAIDGLSESVAYRNALGFRPPRRALERVLRELRLFAGDRVDAHPLLSSFRNRLSSLGLSDGAKADLVARADAIVAGGVRAAYARLITLMESLLDGAADVPGVWRLADGDAYYAFLLRSHTTTDYTADELHEIGHAELARLREAIQAKFRAVGLTQSMADNYRSLLTEAAHLYTGSDTARADVLGDYNEALDIARGTSRLFESLPQANVRIEPVAAAFENSLTHHYSAPARDGSRPGIFHVNLRQAAEGPRWEVPVIAFHETIPGHHLQIALTREMKHLPFFRRVLLFNAYSEGWAKYAETIPFEHGLIDDPYAELGRMRLELYSTVSLILDTGVHAKRWSFDDGVSFLKREIGATDNFATDLVDRVTVLPGQACAYKVGMLAMERHRKALERSRGAAFDLKAFHSLVLGTGSVPLTVLDDVVDQAVRADAA